METFERFFKSGSFKGNSRTRLKLKDNRNELIDNTIDSDNNSNDIKSLDTNNNTIISTDVLKESIDEETIDPFEDIDNDESSVWIEVFDEESGLSYYWNTETNETTSLGDPKPEYSLNEEIDVKDDDQVNKKKEKKNKKRNEKKRLEIIEESSDIQLQDFQPTDQRDKEIPNIDTVSNNENFIDTIDDKIIAEILRDDISIHSIMNDENNNKIVEFVDAIKYRNDDISIHSIMNDENNNKIVEVVDAIKYDTTVSSIIDTETSIEVIQTINMTETPIFESINNNGKNNTLKKDLKKINDNDTKLSTDTNIKSRRKSSVKSNSIKITPIKQKSIKSNNDNKAKERKRGFTTFFVDMFKSVVGNSLETCVKDTKFDKSIEIESTNNDENVIIDNTIAKNDNKQQEVETKDEDYNDLIIEGIASYPPLLEYSEFDVPSDVIMSPKVKLTIERCKICTLPMGTCKHTLNKIVNNNNTIISSLVDNQEKGKISYPSMKKSSKKVDDDYIDFTIDEEALSINWNNDQLKIKKDLLTVIVSSFDLNDEKIANKSISDKTNDILIKELNNTIQDKFLANSNIDDIRQAAASFRHILKQDKLKINLQNDLQLQGRLCNYPIISSPRNQNRSSNTTSPIQKRSKNIIGHSTCLTYIPKTSL